MGSPVLGDMSARLEASRDDVASKRKALELAIKQRNRLIVTAVDGGMSQGAVANAAGIGQPHVVRVLAKPDDVELDAA